MNQKIKKLGCKFKIKCLDGSIYQSDSCEQDFMDMMISIDETQYLIFPNPQGKLIAVNAGCIVSIEEL